MAFSKFATAFDGKSWRRAWDRTDRWIRGHHYDPNQPRVPAGNPDGGQWTAAGGYSASVARTDDDRAVSDATPENDWRPGAQYAGRVPRRTGGGPATPGQLLRLEFARARADKMVRAVQEREPNWQPRSSLHRPNSINGQIAAQEGRAQEAEARLQVLSRNGIGFGPFVRDLFPAGQFSRALERELNNRNGDRWGCHTCGRKDPGTSNGCWIRDHQPSTALNEFFGRDQYILPHCASCSGNQGAWITNWLKSLRRKGR